MSCASPLAKRLFCVGGSFTAEPGRAPNSAIIPLTLNEELFFAEVKRWYFETYERAFT